MTPDEAALDERFAENVVFLELHGEWELSNVKRLTAAFTRISRFDVLVDMRDVSYCDSSVLSELVNFQRRMQSTGHRVEVALAGSKARRIFQITHLDQLLEASADRLRALESIKARTPTPITAAPSKAAPRPRHG
ncbi:MAG: STAS domain-containing protein [Candidatus Eremiobacteraeota bacterium]|nr:STAS domain-containing protein [Candidatus Eremiobacteraeota bacterium]